MPKTNLEKAQTEIERDLCLLTGDELLSAYKPGSARWDLFHDMTGKIPPDVAEHHNPFFYYAMSVWFDKPVGRALIHPPRHRDEMADRLLRFALGEYDDRDGLHIEWPRRALKSTWLMAFADWVPKFHKYRDDLDITVLYTHNSQRAAERRLERIKWTNRTHSYIKRNFNEAGKVFVVPDGEWGNKEEWDWPCRNRSGAVVEKSMTARSAMGKKAGAGYNYKLIDDWEDEDSMESEDIRENLEIAYSQLRQLDAVPFAREASVGTPYHLHGLQTAMLEKTHEDGTTRYETLFMPALTDDNEPNFPTIPKLSVKSLAKERANIIERTGSDAFWYLQYMLDRRLKGFESMQWEWFQPLPDDEYLSRWNPIPHFTCVYGDSAWKGEENQMKGDYTILMVVAHFIKGMLHQRVILDGWASQEASSDQGAEEYCRLMKKWATCYYQLEQQGEKYFGGVMKPVAKAHHMHPVFIDLKAHSQKSKRSRTSMVAGSARMGNMYYLSSCKGKDFLKLLETNVKNDPQAKHDDPLDCLANSFAEVVETQWIPIGLPDYQVEAVMRQEDEFVSATRYTGVPTTLH